MSIVAKRSPISATAEHLLLQPIVVRLPSPFLIRSYTVNVERFTNALFIVQVDALLQQRRVISGTAVGQVVTLNSLSLTWQT